MKKVKFTGKLTLNKETVAKLNDKQMGKVNGGLTEGTVSVCYCDEPTQAATCVNTCFTGNGSISCRQQCTGCVC